MLKLTSATDYRAIRQVPHPASTQPHPALLLHVQALSLCLHSDRQADCKFLSNPLLLILLLVCSDALVSLLLNRRIASAAAFETTVDQA